MTSHLAHQILGWGAALRALARTRSRRFGRCRPDSLQGHLVSCSLRSAPASPEPLGDDARPVSAWCSRSVHFQFSFDAITMVILGGSRSVTGAVLGALFVTFTVKLIELVSRRRGKLVKALPTREPLLDSQALRMVIYARCSSRSSSSGPRPLGERELFGRERS